MQPLFPLSRSVLSEVVVLLGVASLGGQEHATPHGEVDGADAEDRHAAGNSAHPLDAILWCDVCNSTQPVRWTDALCYLVPIKIQCNDILAERLDAIWSLSPCNTMTSILLGNLMFRKKGLQQHVWIEQIGFDCHWHRLSLGA